jgi:hypothetical protein
MEAGHLARRLGWRIPMKSVILVAVATLSLGVGAAFAQGAPPGFEPQHYGSQAYTDHKDVQTQFLGPNTVLGKMFRYDSDSSRVAASESSVRGG